MSYIFNKIIKRIKKDDMTIKAIYHNSSLLYEAPDAFYRYAADGLLSLNDDFKAALNANIDYVVDGELLWAFGTPLPNPGQKATKYGSLVGGEVPTTVFLGMTMTELDLSLWDTSQVTDMLGMFAGCINLTNLNISNFDTSKVTNMYGVFNSCESLVSLDLSHFNTSNVTDISGMFARCINLTNLNISNFDTSKVTNMYGVFNYCLALTMLDLSHFDTSQVTNMSQMFFMGGDRQGSLTFLDVSGWDTSKVTDMSEMFKGCDSIEYLDLSTFDTSQTTTMSSMFNGCASLKVLDLSSFVVTGDTNTTSMFFWCTSVERSLAGTQAYADIFNASIDKPSNVYFVSLDAFYSVNGGLLSLNPDFKAALNANTNYSIDGNVVWQFGSPLPNPSPLNPTSYGNYYNSGVFYDMTVTELDLSLWNTTGVINMSYMFDSCSSLVSLNIDNFNTSSVTNMRNMFNLCSALTALDVSNFNTSNVTNMNSIFRSCSSIVNLDVSNFNTEKVVNMGYMFYEMEITTIDVSNFNTSNAIDVEEMFGYCELLTTIDVSNFNTSKVTNMSGMFNRCRAVTHLDVSNFNTSQVTDMSYMFSLCGTLTVLDVSGFDTSQVTNMSSMFALCEGLTSLNLSSFDTSQVTSMLNMFSSCNQLETLNLSSFDTSKVTSLRLMFYNCSSLTTLDLSSFDTSQVTDVGAAFNMCYNVTQSLARTQADADKLNLSNGKPSNVNFVVKTELRDAEILDNLSGQNIWVDASAITPTFSEYTPLSLGGLSGMGSIVVASVIDTSDGVNWNWSYSVYTIGAADYKFIEFTSQCSGSYNNWTEKVGTRNYTVGNGLKTLPSDAGVLTGYGSEYVTVMSLQVDNLTVTKANPTYASLYSGMDVKGKTFYSSFPDSFNMTSAQISNETYSLLASGDMMSISASDYSSFGGPPVNIAFSSAGAPGITFFVRNADGSVIKSTYDTFGGTATAILTSVNTSCLYYQYIKYVSDWGI